MQLNQSQSPDQGEQNHQEPQRQEQQQVSSMQQENHQNQTVSQENFSPEDDPVDEQEGEINQQQNEDERQSPDQTLNSTLNQAINKDTYINRLQSYLNKVRTDLNQKSTEFQQLAEDNKKTKQTLKKVRFEFLSSKQQISTLTQQKSDLQKQTQSLKSLNQSLLNQIQVFKEAGDVNFFKNKITQLQKLLEIQKQELTFKESMIDEKEEHQNQQTQYKNKVEILSMIEKYGISNKKLEQKLANAQSINLALEKQLKNLELQNNTLKASLNEAESNLIAQKQKIQQLQQALKKKEDDFATKLRQAEESVIQLMQNQQINTSPEALAQQKSLIKNPQEKYGIRILSPIEERDLILKEFIELEVKYLSTTEELSVLRQRHFNTMREIKNISTTHIHKKEYSELYKKYTKLRKCLENSLLNEKTLRKQLAKLTGSNSVEQQQDSEINASEQQNINLESRYRSMILEEPENAINQVEKIVQKSSEFQKNLFTLKQQLQTKQRLIKAQKILKEKEQRIANLEKQIQTAKNINQLYDSELAFKNNEIQLLRVTHQENIHKIYELQQNRIQKHEQHRLESQIQQKRITIQILEIKNLQSIRENTILKNEKQVLTELYNNLKSMYEEILNREPQLQQNLNDKTNQQKPQNTMVTEIPPCKECQQRQENLKQINFTDSQIQTEGLAELYFKEIKSLLTILKKFPQKVDDITGKLDSEKATIYEAKKKFDQVIELYGAKYRQLDEEKRANDQWRVKQKEDIREEFQDIRELLINQRLVTALKKAKSLIEYYEQNAPQVEEEGNPEEGEEEGNEKNDAIGEQPIEEEKDNP